MAKAGRPKGALGNAALEGKSLARKILQAKNEIRIWEKLLDSEDENIVLKAIVHLSDRAYGKPTESFELSGTVNLADVLAKARERANNGGGSNGS
jgi:hypothetical protein